MTREQAYLLHNPFDFKKRSKISEFSVLCRSEKPDLSLLRGKKHVVLIFPNQDWINLAAEATWIKAIYVDRSSARDLSPLTSLDLFNFSASYPSRVKDWSFLSKFSDLTRLVLENTLSIQDLEAIQSMAKLEVLYLSGGYSSVLKLPSLFPLACLTRIKIISLASVRFNSWDLSCLLKLPDLCVFDCPLWCPSEEIEKLKHHNPNLISNWLELKSLARS
jgi:hypothetical protein